MPNPHLLCAELLQKILEDKVFFAEFKKYIPEKDRPLINMLLLTSLRYYNSIKTLLYTDFLRKKIPHKHRMAEYLLIIAMSEILYMNTPQYAVINETVSCIKKCSNNIIGGMANAVLRKIVTQKTDILQTIKNISPLPQNFLDILKGYTSEEINQISHSVTEIPPLDISCKQNTLKWQKELNAELLPNGSLRLYQNSSIKDISGYSAGEWWVQDVAAALPVSAMGNIKGKKILDLCAAPGGKTAQLLAKNAEVTAVDISTERLQTLHQNMQRLHFDNLRTINDDALNYLSVSNETYDAILLDAPCSASGTFRRHPEVLHIKSWQDAEQQISLQKQLLGKCKNLLKKGGILIYSVCSICKAEGEEQIADFLRKNNCFKLLPIHYEDISEYGVWSDSIITPEGYIRTLPFYLKQQKGMDSFFICKMQRII